MILQGVALSLTINNHAFHRTKFITSANIISGGLYQKTSNISEYFKLKDINHRLVQENLKLKQEIAKFKEAIDSTTNGIKIDTAFKQQYSFIDAKIIKNSYTEPYNFITLNKGLKDSIAKEMGVINSLGIIGVTDKISTHFSRAQSVLNKDAKINARLKNSNYFGTLTWNGLSYTTMQLTDLPRQAPVQIGDTIITGGRSTIFPEGILIGVVSEINQGNTSNTTVNIKLFNDMSNLREVYIVTNLYKQEQKTIENLSNE